jgi:hypothetical protein
MTTSLRYGFGPRPPGPWLQPTCESWLSVARAGRRRPSRSGLILSSRRRKEWRTGARLGHPAREPQGAGGKKAWLVVPLSPQVVQVFEELKRKAGNNEWIFAGDRQSNLSANFGRLGAALKKATRVDFSFHDFRATLRHGHWSAWRGSARSRPLAGPSWRTGHAERDVALTTALIACPRSARHSTDGPTRFRRWWTAPCHARWRAFSPRHEAPRSAQGSGQRDPPVQVRAPRPRNLQPLILLCHKASRPVPDGRTRSTAGATALL